MFSNLSSTASHMVTHLSAPSQGDSGALLEIEKQPTT